MNTTNAALISYLKRGIYDVPDGLLARSAAGPVPVDILERALELCISGHKELDGLHELNPRFILARAWSEDRLAQARKRLAEGFQNDPIEVVGIQFPELPTYYLVTDGMHRTVASRLADKPTIRGQVSGCHICDPDVLKLVKGMPWHFSYGKWRRSMWGRESDAIIHLLILLGVESLNRLQWALRRVPKAKPGRRIIVYDPGRSC